MKIIIVEVENEDPLILKAISNFEKIKDLSFGLSKEFKNKDVSLDFAINELLKNFDDYLSKISP